MMLLPPLLAAAGLLLANSVNAEPVKVQLDKATILGIYNTTTGVDSFLGVKYAQQKRFEHGVMVTYKDRVTINATVHAPACAQINNATGYNTYGNAEDCLFVEVYRPHDTRIIKKPLPVLVWIHGGGGNYGSANGYVGDNFVRQSKAIGMPVIVVTVNYRLAAWGMLGGKEAFANKAVNLALYDQQTAMKWVQKNIEPFGGDPSKVTLWGESSGSMSVHYHYLDQQSHLFRAAIMESGNVNSVPALESSLFQTNYDALVAATGCNTSADTLSCLKKVDFAILQTAVNNIVANTTAYSTRPWGITIESGVKDAIVTDKPSKLVAQGKFSRKPFIHADVMDEGTFYPKPLPMETVDQMWAYFETDYVNKGSTWLRNETTKAKLLELYPADPAFGSPFNTGEQTFGLGATYKRAAALYGDIRYQAPRRSFFADAEKYDVKGWAFELSQFPPVPPGTAPPSFGVYHTADIYYVWMMIPESQTAHYNLSKQMVNYLVTFANKLDPNYPGSTRWPAYGNRANLMNFTLAAPSIIPDTYRKDAIGYLVSVQDQFGNPRK